MRTVSIHTQGWLSHEGTVGGLTRFNPRHSNQTAGVKGIVFDKDNTLTAPYVDTAHEAVAEALETSKRVFGADRLLILSNSAGTGDDPGAAEARTMPCYAVALRFLVDNGA